MISVAEARARIFALCADPAPEAVPLRGAAGRVLLQPALARRDQPPFAASAMDGYAVAGTGLAPGARFLVVGEAAAGHRFAGRAGAGEAVRIFTGAPLPDGTDFVVIQEDVRRTSDMIEVLPSLGEGSNVRAAGGDFRVGDTLAAPRRLRPAELALLAAMNVAEVHVARRPVVALIATGDELVMPGEAPGPDQIVASNLFALAAMAEAEGAEVRMLPIARDRADSLRMVLELAEGADVIVTIGGASVGDHDIVADVAAEMGLERAFYKIAMRPGKPLMAGRMRGALMLGLPGNPVSAIVCGQLFLLPLLRTMQGLPKEAPRTLPARLGCALPANGPREHYMRARLAPGDDGLPLITPFTSQDSALLGVLSEAAALLVRPVDDAPRAAGERVEYLPL
jgi:molybdopterin molybdotransferase